MNNKFLQKSPSFMVLRENGTWLWFVEQCGYFRWKEIQLKRLWRLFERVPRVVQRYWSFSKASQRCWILDNLVQDSEWKETDISFCLVNKTQQTTMMYWKYIRFSLSNKNFRGVRFSTSRVSINRSWLRQNWLIMNVTAVLPWLARFFRLESNRKCVGEYEKMCLRK